MPLQLPSRVEIIVDAFTRADGIGWAVCQVLPRFVQSIVIEGHESCCRLRLANAVSYLVEGLERLQSSISVTPCTTTIIRNLNHRKNAIFTSLVVAIGS